MTGPTYYSVTARLGSVGGNPSGAEAAFSSTMNLWLPPQSFVPVWDGVSIVNMTWAHPSYGQPAYYQISRGVAASTVSPLVTLGGGVLSWADGAPNRGAFNTYGVRAGLNAGLAGSTQVMIPIPAANPVGVSLTDGTPSGGLHFVNLNWSHPSGLRTGYEVVFTDNGVDGSPISLSASSTSTQLLLPGFPHGTHLVQARIRTLSGAGPSSFTYSNFVSTTN